jgi:hypothetical protein
MRRTVLFVTTLVFAVAGARFSAPHDRRAGEPFAYEPPEGFTPVKDDPAKAVLEESSVERQWTHPPKSVLGIAPRVHVSESRKGGTVEAEDLERIARGMPSVLEPNGVTWTDVRRETRTRADGARVGLIEGECTKKVEEAPFAPADARVRYRRLLFVFPTDEGVAVTTAVYGKDEIATWQPAFEATIGKARGVAVRVPPPPAWLYFAWGGAGLVLGWLALSLIARRESHAPERDGASGPRDAGA